jgi:hypothetical protein
MKDRYGSVDYPPYVFTPALSSLALHFMAVEMRGLYPLGLPFVSAFATAHRAIFG